MVALAAIVTAAVSFAVVDASVAGFCTPACSPGVPIVPITFAALGALALLVSVFPAVTWIVATIRRGHLARSNDSARRDAEVRELVPTRRGSEPEEEP